MLRVKERAPTLSLFPLLFTWDFSLSPSKSWGCAIQATYQEKNDHWYFKINGMSDEIFKTPMGIFLHLSKHSIFENTCMFITYLQKFMFLFAQISFHF
jgi:hypothetical protein